MFAKRNSAHGGRYTISIVKGYRENGKVKQKVVQNFGYEDVLMEQFDNPLEHFKELARQMTLDEKDNMPVSSISFNPYEKLPDNTNQRFNLGYCVIKKLYHILDIDTFFSKKQRNLNIEYKLNDIFKLLIFSRILSPSSKLSTYQNKDRYFDKFDFSEKDMYRSLDILHDIKDDLQVHIHSAISEKYGRDTSTTYYDCTNYYFEIDEGDEFRENGPSKEHRKTPIVQMGLLMDNDGIPLAYDLFPGNQSEKLSLVPILKRVRRQYNTSKTIVVADRGLNTSDNIFYNLGKGDGYIYSQTIKGANKELKDYVSDEDNYIHSQDGFKIKSRIYPKILTYHDSQGKIKKQSTDQKQVIFYSPDYDRKAKAERSKVIEKAKDLISHKGAYTKATSYGAAGYIKNLEFDKKTGEVISKDLSLDIDKIKEDEKYDGYYAIVTSEINMKDNDIIEKYRGLWKIEESFKITKSTFNARPVYLSKKKHIEAHFLTCFVSLVLMRLIEKEVEHKYSIQSIINSLNSYSCSYLKENTYVFDYRDNILIDLEKIFNLDLSRKYLSQSQIKNILKK